MITLGGVTAFETLGAAAVALVLVAHFVGFYIRGALGFGSNMPIVLLTTWVLGPHHAILLVALTSGIAQVHLLPQGFRDTDWHVARMLALGMMVGITLGIWVFAGIEADWLVLLLGGYHRYSFDGQIPSDRAPAPGRRSAVTCPRKRACYDIGHGRDDQRGGLSTFLWCI